MIIDDNGWGAFPVEMTRKTRIMRALSGKTVDRVPVVVPGGMMAGVLYSLLQERSLPYPAIHTDPDRMAAYTRLLCRCADIDNYGVPFCMTVEAEDFGAPVDLGTPSKEPRVTAYVADTPKDILCLKPVPGLRHGVVIRAIQRLGGGDIPVFGNLTGPLSLLTSLVEAMHVYRAMAKGDPYVSRSLKHVTDHIIGFAAEQMAAGADAIVIADPSAAGDILGDHLFHRFVRPCLAAIIDSIKKHGTPVILHICGNILPLTESLAGLDWDALSVDSIMSLRKLQSLLSGRPLMGNVSTHMLATATEEKVFRASKQAIEIAAILAPACGLSTLTPPAGVRAMVRAAKDSLSILMNGTAKTADNPMENIHVERYGGNTERSGGCRS